MSDFDDVVAKNADISKNNDVTIVVKMENKSSDVNLVMNGHPSSF